MTAAAEIAASLSATGDRGVGTDAERRAAAWLADEIARPGKREAQLETFWSRPNWAMAQTWHVGLGLAGSLVSVSSPAVGAALLGLALLSVLADATLGISPGRRLTPEHASQNVVSLAPPRRDGGSPPVRLIITANLDAGRQALAYRTGLRRPFARLRTSTVRRAPGWAGWLAIALALTLATALVRAGGSHAAWIKVLQLIPTAGLVIALALLLEMAGAGWSPAANDNASGTGVAIALTRALDAAPPAHAAVDLVLSGAGDGQDLGLRRYLRSHREHRADNTVILGLGPAGEGRPAWLRSDGPLIPLAHSRTLRRLAAEVAAREPELELHELRGRGSSPGLSARQLGLPSVALTARSADGLVPRSHQSGDTAEHLNDAVIEQMLLAGLALADAIDAYLGEGSDRSDRVVLLRPLTLLALGVGEAADEIPAQLLGCDHGVDDQLGGQVQDVDVAPVFGAQLLGPRRPLVFVLDRLELVVVDRVDRRLRPHHGDRGGGERHAAVGVERGAGHRVQAGAIGLAHDHGDLRHGRLGHSADHLGAVADDPLASPPGCRS